MKKENVLNTMLLSDPRVHISLCIAIVREMDFIVSAQFPK